MLLFVVGITLQAALAQPVAGSIRLPRVFLFPRLHRDLPLTSPCGLCFSQLFLGSLQLGGVVDILPRDTANSEHTYYYVNNGLDLIDHI